MSLSSVMALQQVGADQVNYWAAFPLSSPTLVENVVPSNLKVDEVFPSGDDASIKVRKPYTITKQRERWTEEEHQKFLDALKLYGRAWRRIEEHIGTKTAVQIRSHAQKFFSKLEREASLGGSMTSTGPREIEIPPPRPKRKPNHPYPKKASGALSNSPSFEEDTKSPSAVCSAFTPLENSLGAATSTLPSKKTGSAAGSLRLFGQTFVQGFEKPEVDNELMESTGSPRSQVSLEVEETSGVSLVGSNPAAIPWDQSTLVSNVNEPAIVDSISQGPSKFSEWERKLLAANGSGMLGAYHFAQSIPPYWQAFLPSHYVHATKDGANTTAAIAAATYAIASAWQAIQGALITNVDNNTNASIVYNPTAILAAAGKPISFSMPVPLSNEQLKREPAYNCHEGRNESEDPPVNLEESTAECCSGLTDSSRLSSYESNDEMIPSPKRQRKFFSDTLPLCNKSCDSFQNMECEQPLVLDTISSDRECPDHLQEQTNLGVRSSSTEGCVTEGKNSTQNLSDEVTQSVDGKRQTTALDAEQPLNLISEECAPHLSPGNEEPSAKARESFKESNDSDKESEASFSGCNEVRNNSCKGRIVHPVQVNVSGTQIKSGNHLFALKAGAPSSRYSGVGFVPYRKSNTSNSGSKHDYQCGPNLGILR